MTVASKQTSGPPVSMAGDAFMTLPPIVPWARVACEPTIAEASASAVKRSRIDRVGRRAPRGSRARRGGAPPPEPADAAKPLDGVDRDDAVRERRLALARADDEIGAAGDGAGAAAQRFERLLDGRSRLT